MAPGLVETVTVTTFGIGKPKEAPTLTRPNDSNVREYAIGRTALDGHKLYEHNDLLPCVTGLHWDPVKEEFYYDKDLQCRPETHNVLEDGADVFDYIPGIVPHRRYALRVATQAERPTIDFVCRSQLAVAKRFAHPSRFYKKTPSHMLSEEQLRFFQSYCEGVRI